MKITILSTSDVHGYLYPTDYQQADSTVSYGLFRLATAMNTIRQQASNDEWVIAIENGDLIQGSPQTMYTNKSGAPYRERYAKIINQLKYDCGILGNHEFNYGFDYLHDCLAKRHYPILGANLVDQHDTPVIDGPYTLLKRDGVNVAILGLTTAYVPHWETSGNLKNWQFKSALETAKYWVPRLRDLADVVVVDYHGGFEGDLETGHVDVSKQTGENEGDEILKQVPGIDVLVTGHQHRQLAQVAQNVAITQPGERGRFMGQATLELDQHHHVINRQARLINAADFEPNETLLTSNQDWQQATEKWLDQPAGQLNKAMPIESPLQARLNGHPYINLINRIQSDATGVDISATSLFNDQVQGFQEIVTRRQIVNSYVYPNTLAVVAITGAQLKAAIEQSVNYFTVENDQITVAQDYLVPKVQHFNYDMYSGVEYRCQISRPRGQRLLSLTYHGQPVADDDQLKVVLNRYRAGGGGDYRMFSPAEIVSEVTVDMTELIMQYFAKHDEIKVDARHNFKIIK